MSFLASAPAYFSVQYTSSATSWLSIESDTEPASQTEKPTVRMMPESVQEALKQRLREKESARNEDEKLVGRSRARGKANRCLDAMLYTPL